MTNPDAPCGGFCCSRWMGQHKANKKHLDDPSSLPNPDLQILIHPLLSRERFVNVSEETFDNDISLSLKLVSHIFTLDSFVKYVMTMCDGDVHRGSANGSKLKRRRKMDASLADTPSSSPSPTLRTLLRYPKDGHVKVDRKMRSQCRRLMTQLVNMVEFELDNCGSHGGFTIPDQGPLPKHFSQRFARGCRARIRISHLYLEELVKSRTSKAGNYRRLVYMLAMIILHEISHAIGYAVDGHRVPEAYYKNCPYSERGYQMEQQVFGGALLNRTFKFKTCGNSPIDRARSDKSPQIHSAIYLVLEKWPSPVIAKEYETKPVLFGAREQRPAYAEVALCEDEFIAKLLPRKFWEVEAKTFGDGPLRPKGMSWWISDCKVVDAALVRRMCVLDDEHPKAEGRRLRGASRRQSKRNIESFLEADLGLASLFEG